MYKSWVSIKIRILVLNYVLFLLPVFVLEFVTSSIVVAKKKSVLHSEERINT